MANGLYDKMDGLVAVGNREGFVENAKSMAEDLKAEGFDSAHIKAYFGMLIKEVSN